MRRRLKPWQWQFSLIAVGSVLLTLLGGYGVAFFVSRLKAQSAELDAMRLMSNQDAQIAQSQNLWLQRFEQEDRLMTRMKQHPYMDPPNRQILQQQLKEGAEGIVFERIIFAPEECIFQEGEYALCRQQITVALTAHNDVSVVKWMDRVAVKFHGVMAVKSFSLNLQKDHNARLRGEIVWEWAFLRLSPRSSLL